MTKSNVRKEGFTLTYRGGAQHGGKGEAAGRHGGRSRQPAEHTPMHTQEPESEPRVDQAINPQNLAC